MWQLSYRPEVEDDVVTAVAWYDDKLHGLGDEFLSEYLAAIWRIRDNPFQFAIAANGLRPCRLKRFSYIVHFDINGNDILVVALMATDIWAGFFDPYRVAPKTIPETSRGQEQCGKRNVNENCRYRKRHDILR